MELLAHMDAGDRTRWQGDQDERPLSDMGRRQAKAVCDVLGATPVHALFSSPALRCRQTLEPLAATLGLGIESLAGLRETGGFTHPPGWGAFLRPEEAYGGARAAGAAYDALTAIRAAVPEGRVAVCSHGDIVPVLVAFLAGQHGITTPEPRPQRPMWYTLRFDSEDVSIELNPAPPGFSG